MRARISLLLPSLLLSACGGGGNGDAGEGAATPASELGGGDSAAVVATEEALRETLAGSVALADSIEDILRPVPLMRPADEAALRRYSNAAHVERARRLGARATDSAAVEALVEAGRLVRLADSAEHWVIRELDGSEPYVTPDTRALLERVGRRFHDRLGDMGLPALRFEISSVLRTAAGQAALRRRNPNAAAGTSAHEFGTTVDIPYSGYAAPAELPVALPADAPPSLRPELERVAREVVERVAARKSRELQAILGEALREAQAAGEVLVTLERLQPVYHITLARPQGSP